MTTAAHSTLADRRAAALQALARRTPPARQRCPGETQPSGDRPDDPWQAGAYLAATRWLDDAADCEPIWDLDDAVYVEAGDRDLLGQHATARQITDADTVPLPDGSYL